MTELSCIACGAEAWAPLHGELVRCRACSFVRAATIPTPEELAALYGAGYFQGEEYADYLADAVSIRRNFETRLDRVLALAGALESVYEIGCAFGFWLQVAGARGIRAQGIDISAHAVEHARNVLGVGASAGSFAEACIAPGTYQAYCMWDTLEHLAHPEETLAKIARLLPEGGWFFATTGDIGSRAARWQGRHWRLIHPPTHLQYFSRDTVRRFLARNGLQVVRIESAPVWRSLDATLGGLVRFGPRPLASVARAIRGVLPHPLLERARFSLDLGDIMLVCARKARAGAQLVR